MSDEKDRKIVFLVIGRSGCGKDTLVNYMCQKYGLKKLKSYTTRPPRQNEEDTHIFISPEEVKKYQDDIIAYTKIGEFEYFATKSQLKDINFYIIDPKGVQDLENIPNLEQEFTFIKLFIYLPEKERKKRIALRGDSEEAFLKRQEGEKQQFDNFEFKTDLFDYAICNMDLIEAQKELEHIVQFETKQNQLANKKRRESNQ